MARRGLGRGLEAILPTDEPGGEQPRGGARLQEIPIDEISPNRYQPRSEFEEASLADLTTSISEMGLLQPVLVREVDDGYELIAGERRWRAARQAGLQTLPALVRVADDVLSLEHALVENLHREDLNALEEAAAYQQLIDEFSLTQEQVAERVGKSRSAVANTIRLLQLPRGVQRMVVDGVLSAGHGRALLGTDDQSFQEALALKIAASALSVRDVEEAIRRHVADEKSPAPEPGSTKPAALLELEQLLSDRLATRVHVDLGKKRGRIEIEFADLEDLERIFLAISS